MGKSTSGRGSDPDLSSDGTRVECDGAWLVYEARSTDKSLFFSHDPRTTTSRQLFRLDSHLLAEFAALRPDEDGERALAFASRWGPLGLCRHDLPATHLPRWLGRELRRAGIAAPPLCDGVPSEPTPWDGKRLVVGHAESLAGWAAWATTARSLIHIAGRLHKGAPAGLQDWQGVQAVLEAPVQELLPWPDALDEPNSANLDDRDYSLRVEGEDPRTFKDFEASTSQQEVKSEREAIAATIPQQRRLLANAVSRWLRLAGVQLGFDWASRPPERITLGPTVTSLFGALGLQLAMTAGGVNALAFCYGCREPFVPARVHAASERRFCQKCQDSGVRQRVWAAEKRQGHAWSRSDARAERERRGRSRT